MNNKRIIIGLLAIIIIVVAIIYFTVKNTNVVLKKELLKVSSNYIKDKYNINAKYNRTIYNKIYDYNVNEYSTDKYSISSIIEYKYNNSVFHIYVDYLKFDNKRKPIINGYFNIYDDYQVPIIKKEINNIVSKSLGIDKERVSVNLNTRTFVSNLKDYVYYGYTELYDNNFDSFNFLVSDIKIYGYDTLDGFDYSIFPFPVYSIINYDNQNNFNKFKNKSFGFGDIIYSKDMIYDGHYYNNFINKDKNIFAVLLSESDNTYEDVNVIEMDNSNKVVFNARIMNTKKTENRIDIFLKKNYLDTNKFNTLKCNVECINDDSHSHCDCALKDAGDYMYLSIYPYGNDIIHISINKNNK